MSDSHAPEHAARRYDVAVIGAGSAGFSAAITASGQGARVALVGHGTIGGTCVNVGCVPSKTMLRAAEALYGARAANRFAGIAGSAQLSDWSQVIAQKDELVATLRQRKYADLLPQYRSIDYLEGMARLTQDGVAVNGTTIAADKTIIATGSVPKVANIVGLRDVPYLTSTTALELKRLPQSLLVIGGGYIGCELAQMFSRAGTAVTLVTRSRLLPGTEPDICDALSQCLTDEGIAVIGGLSYREIKPQSGGIGLNLDQHESGRQTLFAETVLVATGRSPNVDGLRLEHHGIALNGRGGIMVDQHMQTSRPGVYAAGDVTGHDQFVYMAAYGAKIAALNAVAGNTHTYANTAMPWVVFTDPQVAGVGFTEAAARAAGFEPMTSIVPLDQLPRALAARDTRGLIKLVADAATDRLLGGQILAPEGADSIQTLAIALQHGMTATQLGEMIFPYLTTVESLKLAAQGFGKDVTMLSCCAG